MIGIVRSWQHGDNLIGLCLIFSTVSCWQRPRQCTCAIQQMNIMLLLVLEADKGRRGGWPRQTSKRSRVSKSQRRPPASTLTSMRMNFPRKPDPVNVTFVFGCHDTCIVKLAAWRRAHLTWFPCKSIHQIFPRSYYCPTNNRASFTHCLCLFPAFLHLFSLVSDASFALFVDRPSHPGRLMCGATFLEILRTPLDGLALIY